MTNYIIPGSYVEDKKSTTTILSVTSQDSVGFAGIFKRGYVGKLVQVTSPTIFDATFGDEKIQPCIQDYNAGYYLSNVTSNYYVARAFHYEESESGVPLSSSDQTAHFGWKRETSEPIYKITTPYDIPLLSDSRLLKQFVGNDVLQEKDTWIGSHEYVIGDTVIYGDNKYVCINGHTSASTFSVGSNWAVIPSSIPSWVNKVTYNFGDVVFYISGYKVCVVESTTNISTHADWHQLTGSLPTWTELDDTDPKTYTRGDVVTLNLKYYLCITTHTNSFSDTIIGLNNETYWSELNTIGAPNWVQYQAYSKGRVVTNNSLYYVCKTAVLDTQNINITDSNWVEIDLPFSTGSDFVSWVDKGVYDVEDAPYNQYDLVESSSGSGNFYVSRVNSNTESDLSDTAYWTRVYQSNIIKTGYESDLAYYIFSGNDSDFDDDTTLNKIQEWKQPSVIFQQQYNVGVVLKETLTTTHRFTITLKEGQRVSDAMASCGLDIGGIRLSTFTVGVAPNVVTYVPFTILSSNTIQFEVLQSVGLQVKKGDSFNLSGIIEGTDVITKIPPVSYYNKDLSSSLTNVQFSSSVDTKGVCKGIYNVYDENALDLVNGNVGDFNGSGLYAFAKTCGVWGNNLSVIVVGKEYWESDLNDYGYLKPNYEMSADELLVVVLESDVIVEFFIVTIDETKENNEGVKYYIDDVINATSNYISCKYVKNSFQEVETVNNIHYINNVNIGDASTVSNNSIITVSDTFYDVSGSAIVSVKSVDESFKYKVVFKDETLAFDLYINDVKVTPLPLYDTDGNTLVGFTHNGWGYTISGTSVVGNYIEWNNYHELDASGIRIKFTLKGGVTSSDVTTEDIIQAYSLFNNDEVDCLLPVGGTHYNTSELTQLTQGITRDVLAKKINVFGLFNVPYDVLTLSSISNRAEAIATWSNRGGFFISDTNEKYQVYDTYFNAIVKNKKCILPKSIFMTSNYLRTFKDVGRHQPVAGTTYGIIGGFDSVVWYAKTKEELEKLFLAQINPTMFKIGKGFINMEQKTFLKKSVVESEANVILSKILIQSDLQKLVDDFTFVILSAQSKFAIETLIKQYLATHITKGTIDTYSVSSVEDPNIYTLRISVKLMFPRALKWIVLEFETLTPKSF